MKTTRRLSMETLERRLVLDGVGLSAVIVCLNDDVADPEGLAKGFVHAHGGQLGHVYEYAVKGFSANLPDAAVEALLKNPHVKRIEPDIAMEALAQYLPTGVDRIDGELNLVAKIDGIDERVNVDIAILDSGIDIDHPDLNVVGGVNTISLTSSYDDGYGHGTHVAGIAAALDNGTGVVGVAPGARLWAVKVLNDRGRGNVSDIIEGIDWVTKHADTIEVANMSLGGMGVNKTYHEAIQKSVAAGVVYMVAAGNSSAEIYGADGVFGTSDDYIPAAYPEVAAISAFADSDGEPGELGPDTSWGENGQDDAWWRMSNFSNSDAANATYYGSGTVVHPVDSPGLGIDLVLPGVDIYSTYRGGGYKTMSGTSMAAPHAAGLAALYIAANGRAIDADGVYAIRQALIDAGKPWDDPDYGISTSDDYYWGGTPDAYRENLGWAGPQVPPVPGNVAPVAVDDETTTDEDAGVTIDVVVNDTDANDDALEVVSVTQASHGSVLDNGDGTVTYTPALNFHGDDSFTYIISDRRGGTATATVTVNVTPVNDAPVAVDDTFSTQQDVTLTVDAPGVLENDSDVDGDTLTAVLLAGPISGSLTLNSNGSFTYTPTTEYTDTVTFTYKVIDEMGASDSATVSIDVVGVSDNSIYVYDIRFESKRANKDWRAVVEIRIDTDGDGTNDLPAAGVTVTVNFADVDYTGTTDSSGRFYTAWITNLKSGTYYANVTSLSLDGYDWKSKMDLEDDTDDDGLPDGVLIR